MPAQVTYRTPVLILAIMSTFQASLAQAQSHSAKVVERITEIQKILREEKAATIAAAKAQGSQNLWRDAIQNLAKKAHIEPGDLIRRFKTSSIGEEAQLYSEIRNRAGIEFTPKDRTELTSDHEGILRTVESLQREYSVSDLDRLTGSKLFMNNVGETDKKDQLERFYRLAQELDEREPISGGLLPRTRKELEQVGEQYLTRTLRYVGDNRANPLSTRMELYTNAIRNIYSKRKTMSEGQLKKAYQHAIAVIDEMEAILRGIRVNRPIKASARGAAESIGTFENAAGRAAGGE